MSERKKPIKVKGSSLGSVTLLLDHQIRLPMDHSDCEAPMTITDETGSEFRNFQKALDFITN